MGCPPVVTAEGCHDRLNGKALDCHPIIVHHISQSGVNDKGSDVVEALRGLGDVSALFPGRPDEKRQPICKPLGRRLFFVHDEQSL